MGQIEAAIAGYLLGSLPFAYWFGLLQGKNLLLQGSGNLGATNVLRSLGTFPALLVVLLDVLKGVFAVALGTFLAGGFTGGLLAGALAVWGHCFSIWVFGKGGKGIATAGGVLLAVSPLMLLAGVVFWALGYLITRNPYRAVLVLTLLFPMLAAAIGRLGAYWWFGLGVGIPITLKHLADWDRPAWKVEPGKKD